MVDVWAKTVAGEATDVVRKTSLLHITKTSEAKSRSTTEWVANHVKRSRRCKPPKGKKLRRGLQREQKEHREGARVETPKRPANQNGV